MSAKVIALPTPNPASVRVVPSAGHYFNQRIQLEIYAEEMGKSIEDVLFEACDDFLRCTPLTRLEGIGSERLQEFVELFPEAALTGRRLTPSLGSDILPKMASDGMVIFAFHV